MSERTYVPQPWTREELDLLAQEWPKGGMRYCRALFPTRTETSIKGKAEALCLRVAGRKPIVRQELTDEVAEQIRRAYQNGKPNLAHLAKRIDRNPGWIKYQARIMGVARQSHPNMIWQDEERAMLTQLHDEGLTAVQIHRRLRQAGFCRSISAIVERISHIEQRAWQKQDWTQSDLAKIFNVDYKVIHRWLERGDLQGKKTHAPSSMTDRPVI